MGICHAIYSILGLFATVAAVGREWRGNPDPSRSLLMAQRPHWQPQLGMPLWVGRIAVHYGELTDWLIGEVRTELADIREALEKVMSQQDEMNADVAALQNAANALQQEVADLEAKAEANQPLDLSGLKAVSEQFTSMAQAAAPAPATADAGSTDTTTDTADAGSTDQPTV